MARSGTVLGSHMYDPSEFLANFSPADGLVTGSPVLASTGTHIGSAVVAKGLVADGLPLRSTVLSPAMKPTRRGLLGPRLEAPLEVATYPLPASDGRGWK